MLRVGICRCAVLLHVAVKLRLRDSPTAISGRGSLKEHFKMLQILRKHPILAVTSALWYRFTKHQLLASGRLKPRKLALKRHTLHRIWGPRAYSLFAYATGYNINYLPQYIAERHGFFRDQGLELEVTIPTPWDGVLDALAEGAADMALGGIWVPSMYRGRVQDYTVFAQIANRCPLALLRRRSPEKFKLEDVVGRTVSMKSIGGASVGLFFKMFLRENGIDPRSVDFIQDLDGVMLGNLFQGGCFSFFQSPFNAGKSYILCATVSHPTKQGSMPPSPGH